MRIEEKPLLHWIDHFYGYGSWQARFWFIAHEEGSGDEPQSVAEKLEYFHRTFPAPGETLCDIRDLYRHVAIRLNGSRAGKFSSAHAYRFGNQAIQDNVWKNLTAFVHGYTNLKMPDPLAYQRKNFASPELRQEALIRLYPLPGAHNHAWYYSWLNLPQPDFLRSREAYEAHLYPVRMHTILSKLRTHKPRAVLMYGMTNINRLKKTVQDFFPGAGFSMVSATPKKIPQHHSANLDGTKLVITTQVPTLRHHRIETGFDWQEFGMKVRPAGS